MSHPHQELARHLAREGARLVLLGMPAGTEFGIDVNSWNVGERFRGVKMIPPGLHFVYFSAVNREGDTAPRTGFFHTFAAREVTVRHYDPHTEDLKTEQPDADEVERIRASLRELDRFLGPYPLESWEKWISLTQHVDEEELKRVIPLSGRVCSATELTPVAGFRSSRTSAPPHSLTNTTTSTTPTASLTTTTTTTTNTTTTDPTTQPTTNTTPAHETDPQTPQPTNLTNTTTTTTITDLSQPTTTTTDLSQPTTTTTDLSQPTTTTTTTSQPTTVTLHPTITTTDISQPTTTTTNISHLPTTTTTTTEAPQPLPAHEMDPRLPEMVPRAGTEFRYTQPPKRSYREGASPSEVTRYSLDSSYSVRHMLGLVERPECLLAELQVAFVSFLVGQVWSGWEHWRVLVGVLCRGEEVMVEGPDLYLKLLSVLHYQVNEIPEDLFVDIVEANNFLASSLSSFFANVEDNASSLPPPLVLKARRFKHHLQAKFEWDFNTLEEEEGGEYAPVVVEMEEEG